VLSTSAWTSIVVTYSGGKVPASVRIYANGVSQSLSTIINTLSGSSGNGVNANIGSYNSGAGLFVNGLLDEVAFYNIALSGSTALALSSSPSDLATVTGIQSWYRFESTGRVPDTASVVFDQVGYQDAANTNVTFSTDHP
jgi:hypothetical protein